MAKSNDQLVHNLLLDAERRGKLLDPPAGGLRKALYRRIDRTVVSPMPGMFARKSTWDRLNPAERHLAVVRTLSDIHPTWIFCSYSAACLYGLEVSWKHLNRIHVCGSSRPSSKPRRYIERHYLREPEIARIGSVRATSPAQTVCTCLYALGFRDGLSIADSALSRLSLNKDETLQAIDSMSRGRPAARHFTARQTMLHADERAESGGESFARATMIATGFAPDHLQYTLSDPLDPAHIMRNDFAWDRMAHSLTLGELDGYVKYTDANILKGKTATDVLVKERQRESHISLYGHPLVRFTMRDVWNPSRLAQMLDIAGIRQTPIPEWMERIAF